MSSNEDEILLQVDGRIAKIILNKPKKLNALNGDNYQQLSNLLRKVAEMKDVTITMFMARGRFFSAGADVNATRAFDNAESGSQKHLFLATFGANNLELTRAFYEHPKLLVAALNGPVVGLTAAVVAMCDFVYCVPKTFLLTPFSSIGLVSEGGASYTFCKRMGLGLANEALIGSKKISAERLYGAGFVNKIFEESDPDKFNEAVVKHVESEFGDHLNDESMLEIKKLIKNAFLGDLEKANILEVAGGVDRFVKGVPQAEFAKIASGAKRHKL